MFYSERQLNQIVAETLLPFVQVADVAARRGIDSRRISDLRQQVFAEVRHLDPNSVMTICRENAKVIDALTRVAPPELISVFQKKYLEEKSKHLAAVAAYRAGFTTFAAFSKTMSALREDIFSDLRAHGVVLQREILTPDEGRPRSVRGRFSEDPSPSDAQRSRARKHMAGHPDFAEKLLLAHHMIQSQSARSFTLPGVEGLQMLDIRMSAIVSGGSARTRDSILKARPSGSISLFITPDGRPLFIRGSGMTKQEEAVEARLFRAEKITGIDLDRRMKMRKRVMAHVDHLFSDLSRPQEKIDFPGRLEREKSKFEFFVDRVISGENQHVLKSCLNQALLEQIRINMPAADVMATYRTISERFTPLQGTTRPVTQDDPQKDSLERICSHRPLDGLVRNARQHPWVIRNFIDGHLSPFEASFSIEDTLSSRGVRKPMLKALEETSDRVDFGRIPVLKVGPYAYEKIKATSTAAWMKFAECVETAQAFRFRERGMSPEAIRRAIMKADIDWDDPKVSAKPLYDVRLSSLAEYLESARGQDLTADVEIPPMPGERQKDFDFS